MAWRLAKSLIKLRAQLDAAFPSRSKISDGSIGNADHARRPSDHNPNRNNVVQAIDATSDPATLNGQALANALYASRDPRIKYLIFNRRITAKPFGTGWKPYTGANAHRHHVHISVVNDPKLYDDATDWQLDFNIKASDNERKSPIKPNPADNVPPAALLVKIGSKGQDVRDIQQRLANLKFLDKSDVDGFYGQRTANAVAAFQTAAGLPDDSIVGFNTRKKLFEKFGEK